VLLGGSRERTVSFLVVKPVVIAHRACPRHAPENSLEGIAKAAELGSDLVEIDVRRTADGDPVLLHDRWLLRTARRPKRLEWVSSAKVKKLRTRGGGTIPTLAEGLAALGPRLGVAIDVKDGGAGDVVISEVRNQGLEERTLFWSQHETAVRLATSTAPEIHTSLLRDTKTTEELERFLTDAVAFGARGISAHWSQVTPKLAERCQTDGLRLYAWCKPKSIDPSRLALLDGLVTNWPDLGAAAVRELA
jgi:glycerophosphoryl diester phosphodiesterase